MDVRKITLTQNKFALVDDDMFDYLNQWKWYYSSQGYAERHSSMKNGHRRLIRMHRVVAATPEDLFTDHINGNKSDNRRKNLRTCTTAQNGANRKLGYNNSTGFKGVSINKQDGGKPYQASLSVNKKHIHLGRYNTREEASCAYNQAAIKYFGEFARLN